MYEDPDRHLGELIDCLMQSARPVGLFLGAGCPCAVKTSGGEALIPDIAGLTKSVAVAIKSSPHEDAWKALQATCAEDGDSDQNIEKLLDRIRGLSSYAGAGSVRGLSRSQLEGLEKAICAKIVEVAKADLPDSDNPYHSLSVWVSSTKRTDPVEIFTTNYDLLTEQAFERNQTPFFDGFVGSRRPFFDVESVANEVLPVRWTRLWKIHGSVNWQRDRLRREIYRSEVGDSVVIHPSNLKYDESRKLPYLALMDRLRRFLRLGQSVLVCSGYSFRDQHINEAIVDSLGSNPAAMVFGLMYGEMDQYKEAKSLARRSANLRLYAQDACAIGSRIAEWREAKSQPDSMFPAGVIDWTEIPGTSSRWKPKVQIGDFRRLGDILDYVSQGRQLTNIIAATSL